MSLRKVLKFPADVLQEKALDVANINGEVDTLVQDMVETMYDAPGVGLAAPQVGIGQRIIVVDTDAENPGKRLFKLINPRIVEREGKIVWEEGCLSVYDFSAEVTRAKRVLVRGWTTDEKEIEVEGEDLLAVALQHEIDHLDGKLFIDRISRLKRDLYKRKLRKLIREGVDLDETTPGPHI